MSRTRRILARDWEVLALLEGRKTVWRRPIPRSRLWDSDTQLVERDGWWYPVGDLLCRGALCDQVDREFRAPYRPGDLVSVREAWRVFGCYPDNGQVQFEYRPGGRNYADNAPGWGRFYGVIDEHWRSSATMPAWAVRHPLLRVVSVRAERLHDRTREDAAAEGIPGGLAWFDYAANYWRDDYGQRFPFSSNPWTWRLEMEAKP